MTLVLSDEGELYAKVETTYGTTPAASTLVAADVQNLKTLKTVNTVLKVETEDQGGGMIPGVPGQPVLLVGKNGDYSGSMLMREFTVVITDEGSRPPYDIWLRAGGFLEGVYDVGTRTITYNMSLANSGESIVYRYRQWTESGGRVLHDVQGARHGLKFKWFANQGLEFDLVAGKALSYARSDIVATDAPPSLDLGTGQSVIPYIGATVTLTEIGGSTFDGKIREINIGMMSRTEMLPDGASATGFCEAFSNPIAPTFDLLVYEVDSTNLSIRDAWETPDAHFRLVVSYPGPSSSGNTLSVNLFFDIVTVAEEVGPVGTLALRVTCKLLYGERTNNLLPGVDPSESPVQLVLTTT